MINSKFSWFLTCFLYKNSYLKYWNCISRATFRCSARWMWPAGRTLPRPAQRKGEVIRCHKDFFVLWDEKTYSRAPRKILFLRNYLIVESKLVLKVNYLKMRNVTWWVRGAKKVSRIIWMASNVENRFDTLKSKIQSNRSKPPNNDHLSTILFYDSKGWSSYTGLTVLSICFLSFTSGCKNVISGKKIYFNKNRLQS